MKNTTWYISVSIPLTVIKILFCLYSKISFGEKMNYVCESKLFQDLYNVEVLNYNM